MPKQKTEAVQSTEPEKVSSDETGSVISPEIAAKQFQTIRAIRAELKVPEGKSDDEIFTAIDRTKQEFEDLAAAKFGSQLEVTKREKLSLLEENGKLSEKVVYLEDQLKQLRKEENTPGDLVILGGVRHVITTRERCWELVQHWKKHFVEDDDLALVVKKA